MTVLPREGRLAIDARQRIMEWDHGAEALLGVPRQEAEGRACFEVVGGRDASGNPVCGPDCPGISAIRRGRLSAGVSLRAVGDGEPLRLLCRLTALPAATGGAVVSLSRPGADSVGTGRPSEAPAPLITDDLAALATMTASLAGVPLPAGLERALEVAREATGADVAELFLAEPGGKGMVLTCHRGSFRHAFYQELRFGPGEGFPGRVLSSGEPVLSASLQDDPRYLRARVKEAGFSTYVCAPLHHGGAVVGSIGLAFRHATDAEVARAHAFLLWAGGPIGTAVQATLAAPYTASDMPSDGTASSGRLEGLLKQMMEASDAEAGEVRLFPSDRPGEEEASLVTLGSVPAACRPLESGHLDGCPVFSGGRGEVLYGRPGSCTCRGGAPASGLRLCVPLVDGGAVIGLVSLWRRRRGDEPPSRSLVMVEALAEAAGRIVAHGRLRQDAERRARDLYLRLPQGVQGDARAQGDGRVQGDARAQDDARVRGAQSGAAVAGEALWERPPEAQAPRFDARCFGPFELRVRGVPVPTQAVGRKKALTLLKILLAHHGRPVQKDALVEWLWPGAGPREKSGQLYVLAHELRRILEPPGVGEPVHVLTDGDGYRFDPASSARIDEWEFRELAALAAKSEQQGDLRSAVAAGEAAARLYRGDFMEDEPYAEWCWQERETLRETCLEVLRRLAATLGASGGWSRSVVHLRAAVRLDPLREAVHRDLMYALWAAGRRDEAVQQYQLCEELLRRELGVGPLPETARLLERIRMQPRP